MLPEVRQREPELLGPTAASCPNPRPGQPPPPAKAFLGTQTRESADYWKVFENCYCLEVDNAKSAGNLPNHLLSDTFDAERLLCPRRTPLPRFPAAEAPCWGLACTYGGSTHSGGSGATLLENLCSFQCLGNERPGLKYTEDAPGDLPPLPRGLEQRRLKPAVAACGPKMATQGQSITQLGRWSHPLLASLRYVLCQTLKNEVVSRNHLKF